MKNRMADVRDHLVATLEALQDSENPMDLARAKTVSDVAQTYINAVKVEVDAYRAADLATVPESIALPASRPRLVSGG